ncbi:MAG: siderophore-interacting protein [Alphaproteobacteria bacterium]|nr:siderophore-interacting protein [Alphaproteobacteria bacterium]
MRRDPLPPFQAEAAAPDLPYAQLAVLIARLARTRSLELHVGHGRSSWCKLAGGEFGARMGPLGSIIYVRGDDRTGLERLRADWDADLAQQFPGLALDWSRLDREGAPPPNFSLARLAGVSRLAGAFLRLRIEGPDLDRFARQLIHFRLVIQPNTRRAPVWPAIGARGQVIWPKGADALHRPVYTVRAIDAGQGWMEADVFLHPGGRAARFARQAPANAPIGLTGPGGGGIPQASRLLIGGDETAYPALARIIAAQDQKAVGECHLFGKDADYPFPAHPGIRVIHAPQGEAALAARLVRTPTKAQAVWLATERSALTPLKAALDAGAAPHAPDPHLAVYWTATPKEPPHE